MCDTLKDKYQLLEEIGRGRFGTIYRCFCPLRNSFFACKIIDKTVLTDPVDQHCIENESKIMTLLHPHPHILSIIDVIETPETLSLIIELCQTQTLYDKIVHQRSFREPEAASFMKQLLTAVSHCHRLGVIHRDLKPDNVLLDNMNNIKLGDFGSSVYLGLEQESGNGGVGAEGVVGTPYYVAPEVLMGKEYNEKVDVWSCGVILYIMICGVPPFYGECVEEVFEKVLRGNLRFPPKLFRSASSEVKDLLRKMICRDVGRRLSAEQALRHPWLLNGGETSSMVDLT